ncbi:MAG: rRNA pseudouridine synthase [Defluviitaleaceae bacterium]|nr:rRNA pseudouridine synthase [Defluviitaleaceae bacterium]
MRLQKILAQAGVASRRKAEELISEGRVSINGEVATLGTKANPSDKITIDGNPLNAPQEKRYIMLHKPEGVVTTARDQFNRPCVLDLVPDDIRVFPVGRLDYDTSGLLFLTNDGEWANMLTHPSHEVEKKYIATFYGIPSEQALKAFRTGIEIDDRITAPAKIKIITQNITAKGRLCYRHPAEKLRRNFPAYEKTISTAQIIIHEGRNRQVRKMCEAIGHPALTLKRVAIGKIKLADLPPGEWRNLTENEVRQLCPKKS